MNIKGDIIDIVRDEFKRMGQYEHILALYVIAEKSPMEQMRKVANEMANDILNEALDNLKIPHNKAPNKTVWRNGAKVKVK